MDNQRGLGHVMDIGGATQRRSIYSIKEVPLAYADLYFYDPKLWGGDIYLKCKPFSDTLKDFIIFGTDQSLYLAMKFPLKIAATVKNRNGTLIGYTPAEKLLLNYKEFAGLKFFLEPIAYGQLITSLIEIPGVMPKDKVHEIVIFNLTGNMYNLEYYLQKSKEQISSAVYHFWQVAFKSLDMVHKKNVKIGESAAKNAFIIQNGSEELIEWANCSQSDTLPSSSSQPLVKNMKRLLDINRLLLDNAFIWSLADITMKREDLYNEIYKITQENVPALENVIFFSIDLLSVDDYTWTDSYAITTLKTKFYTDADLTTHLKLIYNKDNVKKRTDIPKLEKYIENVKAIKFDEVFQYLTTRLDTYVQLLQVRLLQKNTQALKGNVFLPWLFQSQQLWIKTSQGQKIGPIFINSFDKKLYATVQNNPQPLPSTQCYLETSNEEVRNMHGGMVVFYYSENHADIVYLYDGEERYIKTDQLQNETNLKLFPKTSTVYSADSTYHSQTTPLPRVMPTRVPLEKNTRYLIPYDNDSVLAMIVDNHYCLLAYQINLDNSIQIFYGFDHFEPFRVPSITNAAAFGYSKDFKWKVIVDTVFSFEYPFIVFTTNGQFNRKVNLLFMRQP